jgi:hypothetical protein
LFERSQQNAISLDSKQPERIYAARRAVLPAGISARCFGGFVGRTLFVSSSMGPTWKVSVVGQVGACRAPTFRGSLVA